MLVNIIFTTILQIAFAHQCHSPSKTFHPAEGRVAISILYPDNNSGVKGIVTMHQLNELAPLFL
jgi:hypothetical protein